MDILNSRLTVMVAVLSQDGHCIPYVVQIKSPTFFDSALIYNQAFCPKVQTPISSPPEDTLCTPESPLNFPLQMSHLGPVQSLYI